MKRTSTQQTTLRNANQLQAQATPRKSTLDFICQFARAYQPQPQLHPSLSGFIAN